MKILVTGGAGFIGSSVIKRFLAMGYEVVCLDNFNDYYDPAIKERNIKPFARDIKLYREDIRNIEKTDWIFARENIDKVCHIAGQAGVRASIANPHIYQEINLKGTLNLLDMARKYGINHFVQASSSSVYGNYQGEADETFSAELPLSPYAATKRAAELMTYTYHQLYKINCTILRFFTVYGPGGRPDMAPYIFTDCFFKGLEIKKFGDGTSRRDYTYIDDITAGILSAMERPFPFEIINLGNNQPVSLNDFLKIIEDISGKKTKISPYEKQNGDVDSTWANINRAGELLGYYPVTTVREGMCRFIEWYRENVKTGR